MLVESLASGDAYIATSGLRRAVETVVRGFKGLFGFNVLQVDNNLTEASSNADCDRVEQSDFDVFESDLKESVQVPDLIIHPDSVTAPFDANTRGDVDVLDAAGMNCIARIQLRQSRRARDQLKVRLHLVAAVDGAFSTKKNAVLNGHSLTALQTFKAFGNSLSDKRGQESKMANGAGVVKTKIVQVVPHTRINITGLPVSFLNKIPSKFPAKVLSWFGLTSFAADHHTTDAQTVDSSSTDPPPAHMPLDG